MLLLLVAAGVLSAALGDVTEAVVILVVVVLNAAIGFRQEYRAEQAMTALQAMSAPTVRVVRAGETREVPASEVVPGDVVALEAGTCVHADGRVVEADSMRVEEAALTGESAPGRQAGGPVAAEAPLAEGRRPPRVRRARPLARRDRVDLGGVVLAAVFVQRQRRLDPQQLGAGGLQVGAGLSGAAR
jgi:magnesium-transporting ATPase (P-type)